MTDEIKDRLRAIANGILDRCSNDQADAKTIAMSVEQNMRMILEDIKVHERMQRKVRVGNELKGIDYATPETTETVSKIAGRVGPDKRAVSATLGASEGVLKAHEIQRAFDGWRARARRFALRITARGR